MHSGTSIVIIILMNDDALSTTPVRSSSTSRRPCTPATQTSDLKDLAEDLLGQGFSLRAVMAATEALLASSIDEYDAEPPTERCGRVTARTPVTFVYHETMRSAR